MAYELVAIGASWGGLAAVEQVLSALPSDFAPAIAIAQHRSPSSDSEGLTSLLSRRTGHTVRDAADKDAIVAGEVHLAPPDYHLIVEPGSFALSTDAAVQYSRPSIDVLFDSAADAYGERLIAVILTGANEDGAHGIQRVKRRGGLTIAQDPETAERDEMPAAAIATGAVDQVLPLERIPEVLVEVAGGSDARSGRAA